MFLVAIDEGRLHGDDLAAFRGKDQRPPIYFVEVYSCAVFADKLVVIDKRGRGVPVVAGTPDFLAEIEQWRRRCVVPELRFVGVVPSLEFAHFRGAADLFAKAGSELLRHLEFLRSSFGIGRIYTHAMDVEDVKLDFAIVCSMERPGEGRCCLRLGCGGGLSPRRSQIARENQRQECCYLVATLHKEHSRPEQEGHRERTLVQEYCISSNS